MSTNLIRTATYNAGLLRAFFRDLVPFAGVRGKVLPSALEDLIDSYKVDILFLQEVWNERTARTIENSLLMRKFDVIRPRFSRLFRSGMLVAIRKPYRLVRKVFVPFRTLASADRFAGKGVFAFKIVTPDCHEFLCMGSHMQSLKTKNGLPVKRAEVIAHAEQIEQIRSVMQKESLNFTLPTVLLGDFNVGPGYVEENYNLITKSCDLTQAYLDFRPLDFEYTWDVQNPLVKGGWNSLEPSALIDHCFVRPGKKLFWRMVSGKIGMKQGYSYLNDDRENQQVDSRAKHFGPEFLHNLMAPLSDHYALLNELELVI